jgi:hypothetical protein
MTFIHDDNEVSEASRRVYEQLEIATDIIPIGKLAKAIKK